MEIKKYFRLFIIVLATISLTVSAPVFAVEKAESDLCAGKKSCMAKAERVIDGDTIQLDTGEKVRYIGINAPETVHPSKPVECFGKEASDKNKELLEGKEIRLEKDISDTDKYGRLLRYVFVAENDTEIFINDYLVRNGFANSFSYPPDIKHQKKFQEAEIEARENKRGLWADGVCDDENELSRWLAGFICGTLLIALGILGYGRKFKKWNVRMNFPLTFLKTFHIMVARRKRKITNKEEKKKYG